MITPAGPDKMQYNLLPKYFNQSEQNFSSNIIFKKNTMKNSGK